MTSEEERYVLAPSLDWQLSDRTLLNLNLYYQKDPQAGIYTTVPASGSVKSNPLGQLGSDTFLGDENWNHYSREVTLLEVQAEPRLQRQLAAAAKRPLHGCLGQPAEHLQRGAGVITAPWPATPT